MGLALAWLAVRKKRDEPRHAGIASDGVETTSGAANYEEKYYAAAALGVVTSNALRRNVTTFVKQFSGFLAIVVTIPWSFDIRFPGFYNDVVDARSRGRNQSGACRLHAERSRRRRGKIAGSGRRPAHLV